MQFWVVRDRLAGLDARLQTPSARGRWSVVSWRPGAGPGPWRNARCRCSPCSSAPDLHEPPIAPSRRWRRRRTLSFLDARHTQLAFSGHRARRGVRPGARKAAVLRQLV